MDKNQFASLLNHFTESSSQEAAEVTLLVKEYPYSQLLKTLAARVTKDHQLNNQQVALQQAAVCSTDRTVLKAIMSVLVERSNSIQSEANTDGLEKPVVTPEPPKQAPEHDYADEVMLDLERLQALKHNFEALFDQEGVAIPNAIAELPLSKLQPKISKKERIIQMAKELDQNNQAESTVSPLEPEKKKANKKTSDLDPIVNEIKATRKKIKPESDTTKEQIEIIKQFIKTKPARTPASSADEKPDLASTLKSGEFGDHIVSETLAEILIRQGKKDKAIEVYKKLIWKFPQKKAYFAAQIEDLRR